MTTTQPPPQLFIEHPLGAKHFHYFSKSSLCPHEIDDIVLFSSLYIWEKYTSVKLNDNLKCT